MPAIYKTITIEFFHSKSPIFNIILKYAQEHISFTHSDDKYTVTFNFQEADKAYVLADKLRGIRNKRVLVDGRETLWQEVFCYMWCYALRKRAYDPAFYCIGERIADPRCFFNIWRCRQANMPLLKNSDWISYGHFDVDQLTFIFDKERIKQELMGNLHPYRFCPAIDIDVIIRILDAFPETVNPHINRDWRYFETGIAPVKARTKKIYKGILGKI